MLAIEVKTKLVNETKIREWMKRKNIRSLDAAVKVVRKFVRSSIKRRSGRKKTYELKAWIKGRDGKEREQKMSEHLQSMQGLGNLIKVVRGRKYEANPQTKGEYTQRKGARAGGAPLSWKSRQAGWKDHWLKQEGSILYHVDEQSESGMVYVEPHSYGKTRKTGQRDGPVPQLLEKGGSTKATNTRMIGYDVYFKRGRKDGPVRVIYRKRWSPKTNMIRMQARPFLGPGLEATLKDLPEKWR